MASWSDFGEDIGEGIMGALFPGSLNARVGRVEEAKPSVDAASEVPKLPGILQPPPGADAVPRADTDPESARVAQLMAWYGLSENEARRKVMDVGGVKRLMGDVLTDMHKAEPASVADLQRRLYRAGYYGNAKPGRVLTGRWDIDTVRATVSMFEEVGRLNATGDNRDWQQILTAAERNGPAGGAGGGAARPEPSGYGAAELPLRRAMASLLGRKPNAREVRRFKRRLNEAEASMPLPELEVGDDPTGLAKFGIGPDDIEEDDDDFREGDAGLLAETEVLAKNGVEHAQYRSGQLTGLFEQMMVGGR